MKARGLKRLKVNALTAGLARAIGRSRCSSVRSFVFVATTGRSGTHTLVPLFQTVPRCVALHEPHPSMNGEVMRRYNMGDEAPLRHMFRLRKLPHVYWAARNSEFYIEANHMFIKCFADAAVDAFADRLRVLHLRRDPLSVACSYYIRGCIPGKTNTNNPNLSGTDWLIDPCSRRNVLSMSAELSAQGMGSHDFYKCLWYCYEIEARICAFRRRYPNIPVYRLSTDELNSYPAVARLFENLNLPVTAELRYVVGTRASASPARPAIPDELDTQQIDSFQALCRARLQELDSP